MWFNVIERTHRVKYSRNVNVLRALKEKGDVHWDESWMKIVKWNAIQSGTEWSLYKRCACLWLNNIQTGSPERAQFDIIQSKFYILSRLCFSLFNHNVPSSHIVHLISLHLLSYPSFFTASLSILFFSLFCD